MKAFMKIRENIRNEKDLSKNEHDKTKLDTRKMCEEGMKNIFEKLFFTCLKNSSSILGSISNDQEFNNFQSMLECMNLKKTMKKSTLGGRKEYELSTLLMHITKFIRGGFKIVFDRFDKNRIHRLFNFVIDEDQMDFFKLQDVSSAVIKIVKKMEGFLEAMEKKFVKIRKLFTQLRREFQTFRENLERIRKKMSDGYIHMCLCNKLIEKEREIEKTMANQLKTIVNKSKQQEKQIEKLELEKVDLISQKSSIEVELTHNKAKYKEYKDKARFIKERFKEEKDSKILLEKEKRKWEKLKKKVKKLKRKREDDDDTERPKKRRKKAN